MADHEDYLPGEAPAAHKLSHQNGGVDEISIAGLAGVSAELATHAALPTIHQDAPALIAVHQAIAAAHHVKYTDAEVTAIANGLIAVHMAIAAAHHARYTDLEAEAVADTQIAIHAALSTVHQDAPALIATHAADDDAHHAKFTIAEHDLVARHPLGNLDGNVCSLANADTKITAHALLATVHQNAPALIATHAADDDAHHAKYTDAEARVLHSPISVPPAAFQPKHDNYDWTIDDYRLFNRSALTSQEYFAPVFLPPGATVTKLTLYGFRDDVAADMHLYLRRITGVGSHTTMALCAADWTDDAGAISDSTIDVALVDNSTYAYSLELVLDPNDSVLDVQFYRAEIEFS